MRHKILLAEMDMTRVSDALPRDAKSPFRFCTARAIPDSMARSSKLREATPQGVTSLITCAYFSWTWGLSSRMTLAETLVDGNARRKDGQGGHVGGAPPSLFVRQRSAGDAERVSMLGVELYRVDEQPIYFCETDN